MIWVGIIVIALTIIANLTQWSEVIAGYTAICSSVAHSITHTCQLKVKSTPRKEINFLAHRRSHLKMTNMDYLNACYISNPVILYSSRFIYSKVKENRYKGIENSSVYLSRLGLLAMK